MDVGFVDRPNRVDCGLDPAAWALTGGWRAEQKVRVGMFLLEKEGA